MHGLKRRWSLAFATVGVAATALVTAAAGPASVGTTHARACKPYGTLSYGIAGGGITGLDPNTISNAAQWPLQSLVYPGLVEITPDGTVAPSLATKWKASPDLKTWWFWLRRDVKYSDGRAFTSADAVANILRVLDPKVPSQARGNIKDFRSVRAITKYEIRIKLGSPSSIVPDQMFLVRMSDLSDVSKLNTVGNGTGPYKVADFVPNQSLTLVPNTYYSGPNPACFKKIAFIREPDPTSMVTDFTSGRLGMIWQIPVSSVPKIESDKRAQIISPKTVSSVQAWELDTTSPPFDNAAARQALSYAIDRATMVKVAFQGQAIPSLANDLLSSKAAGYDKALKPYAFNLQKAKQLFQQAGVKPGTTFTFWAQGDKNPERITMAEILQQDLQKIGYNLNIVQNDTSTWLQKFYPAGKSYPGLIIANGLSLQPNPVLGLSFATSGKCECNWNNKQFDALYFKALGMADQGKRQAVLNQMQSMFSQAVPVLAIAHQTNILAAQKGIVGAWEDARGNTHLENAHFAGH
ncbi:MAG TPA: ABC transporter substrate-binding protein [Gaiellaceae bacterium]|nr:ABC transporter substrate-binding protein [Gaiellaceae bacterium]